VQATDAVASSTSDSINGGKKSRKRKRTLGIEELEQRLSEAKLSSTWPDTIHTSGAHAVVVFADRASAELSFKAVKKAAKSHTSILWEEGMDEA